MNKRIRELEQQATETVKCGLNGTHTAQVFNRKKFAQLILQDVDNVVDTLYRALPLEQAAVLLTLDENIKQHFWGIDQ